MDITVPPDVQARGPKAIEEYMQGAYLMMGVIAKRGIKEEYGLAAPSTLTQGDECGQGLPPAEAHTWRHKKVGWLEPDMLGEGGFPV